MHFVSLSLSALYGCAGRAATSSITNLHYLHRNNNKIHILFNIRINLSKMLLKPCWCCIKLVADTLLNALSKYFLRGELH